MPEVSDSTGKSVGIIGGGPAGLTAAYFLAVKGHKVTVYDAMPKMGGMLRYGIPQYRLPKEVLDMGLYMAFGGSVTFKNAKKVQEAAAVVPLDKILTIGIGTAHKFGK